MERLNLEDDHKLIAFTEWVKEFCIRHNVPNLPYDEEKVNHILNREYSDTEGLTSEECFSSSMILMNYAAYLQREIDFLRTLKNRCSYVLSFGYASRWNQFDQYMPAEVKKQAIINESEYLPKVQENELRLSSGVQMLEKQCEDIRNRANLYKEMGKKR